jgi:hypothetical protein
VLFENPGGAAFRLAFIIIAIIFIQGGMRRLNLPYVPSDEQEKSLEKVTNSSGEGAGNFFMSNDEPEKACKTCGAFVLP